MLESDDTDRVAEDGQEEALDEANEGNPQCKDGLTIGMGSGHASEHPLMVMVDDATGNKYMRAVSHKGVGFDGDQSWLVKDMHRELKPDVIQAEAGTQSS